MFPLLRSPLYVPNSKKNDIQHFISVFAFEKMDLSGICISTVQVYLDSVNGSIFKTHCNDSTTFAVFHQEIQGKVFDEVVTVVPITRVTWTLKK